MAAFFGGEFVSARSCCLAGGVSGRQVWPVAVGVLGLVRRPRRSRVVASRRRRHDRSRPLPEQTGLSPSESPGPTPPGARELRDQPRTSRSRVCDGLCTAGATSRGWSCPRGWSRISIRPCARKGPLSCRCHERRTTSSALGEPEVGRVLSVHGVPPSASCTGTASKGTAGHAPPRKDRFARQALLNHRDSAGCPDHVGAAMEGLHGDLHRG